MTEHLIDLPQTLSLRLDGKTALMTGAGSSIGLGCAVALAGGPNLTGVVLTGVVLR